jgi:type 1 glutamine amidotransferase
MSRLLFLAAMMLATPGFAFKVLVFSKTAGFRHASIEPGIQALKKMAEKHQFEADFTEDASTFTEENLKKYQVVLFLNTTGDVFDDKQQNAFKNYIQKGGGFVGIHAATDTEYGWPWFGGLVGAYFLNHPNNPNVKPGKFEVLKENHWSTKHMPKTFMHTDEFYNFKDISSHIIPVLAIDEKSYTGGKHPDFHPMSWYHEYDGGKAFYTALGHTNECYTDELFLQHVWAGIQYAAGKITAP